MRWSESLTRRRCEPLATSTVYYTYHPRLRRAIYKGLDYSISDIEESAGSKTAISSDKATVLMGRMRYPCLSLHGIEGAFHGVGAKTVIPAKVAGKFSIR